MDSFWYTLDNGVTNITITSLTGTINPSEWDKHGNGTVNIRFYAKDEGDNEGFAEITVRKDVIIPLITINAPIINNIFGFQPPQYNVSIIENNIDKMWYTLDSGVITVPFVGNTGIINQTEWEKIENGTVTITFYANDSVGNIGQACVDVHKDILGPIITINSPQDNEFFGFNAPNYDLSIEEFNLDSMWYTIDGGLTIIPIISLVGIIEQTEWEKKEGGTIPIRFYAVESDSTPSNNQGNDNFNSTNVFAIMMTLGITVGSIIPFIGFAEIKVRKIKKLEDKTSTKIIKEKIKF